MRAPLSPLALCLSLAAWAGLQALLPPADAAPEVFHADLFGFPIISTIGSFLTRLLRNDPGSTGATVGRAIVNLQSDLGTLGGSLKDFVGEMRDWLGTLVKLLDRLRDSALVPLVKWLREKMKWLKDWLKRTFGPLLKILKTIRARVLDVYTRFIRPILDVIDVLRFFLQTLKRLGVEWAGELDVRLGKLENAIVSNFTTILSHLNRVIDVVDSVITLELLFQRVPFLRTLVRDAKYLNRIWWHVNLDKFPEPEGRNGEGELIDRRPIAQDVGELREFFTSGGGPRAGIVRELRAVIIAAAEGRGK